MTIYTDNNISLKAKGLYLLIQYLNSKNENITRVRLCEMTSTKEKSLITGINELKENGYLEIIRINTNGKFSMIYKLLK